jgi:hypothetical protein
MQCEAFIRISVNAVCFYNTRAPPALQFSGSGWRLLDVGIVLPLSSVSEVPVCFMQIVESEHP